METFNLRYNLPIRNLQTFLREISYYYHTVPPVIPDGIFGNQTKNAVIGFQSTFELPLTGEVDNETWDKIILVYDNIIFTLGEPNYIKVFPSPLITIQPNDQSEHLFAIQGILLALTRHFTNLGTLQNSGVHDPQSVSVIKKIQLLFGYPSTGVIDKPTWDMIARLYEVFISRNRLEPVQ